MFLMQISIWRNIPEAERMATLKEMNAEAIVMARTGRMGGKLNVNGNVKEDPFPPVLRKVLKAHGYKLDYINYFYWRKVEDEDAVQSQMEWFETGFLPLTVDVLDESGGEGAQEKYVIRASEEPAPGDKPDYIDLY